MFSSCKYPARIATSRRPRRAIRAALRWRRRLNFLHSWWWGRDRAAVARVAVAGAACPSIPARPARSRHDEAHQHKPSHSGTAVSPAQNSNQGRVPGAHLRGADPRRQHARRRGRAALAGAAAAPRRIVVIGDTGCRLKGKATPGLQRPRTLPFARVAASAAAFKPDLVIHVGDYHYREDPCPAERPAARAVHMATATTPGPRTSSRRPRSCWRRRPGYSRAATTKAAPRRAGLVALARSAAVRRRP